MNRKGQSIMMGVIFGLMIFIAGMLFVNFISERTLDMLGTSGLDCESSTISDGVKVTCLIGELVVPYFIVIFISLAGAVILTRFVI